MVVVVVLIWLEIGPGTIAAFGYKSKLFEIAAPVPSVVSWTHGNHMMHKGAQK